MIRLTYQRARIVSIIRSRACSAESHAWLSQRLPLLTRAKSRSKRWRTRNSQRIWTNARQGKLITSGRLSANSTRQPTLKAVWLKTMTMTLMPARVSTKRSERQRTSATAYPVTADRTRTIRSPPIKTRRKRKKFMLRRIKSKRRRRYQTPSWTRGSSTSWSIWTRWKTSLGSTDFQRLLQRTPKRTTLESTAATFFTWVISSESRNGCIEAPRIRSLIFCPYPKMREARRLYRLPVSQLQRQKPGKWDKISQKMQLRDQCWCNSNNHLCSVSNNTTISNQQKNRVSTSASGQTKTTSTKVYFSTTTWAKWLMPNTLCENWPSC